jgi:L-malate glycosyltransferase
MELTRFFRDLSKKNTYPKWLKYTILPVSSWFFQGLLYMDRTERNFKLFIDLLLIFCLFPVFIKFLTPVFSGLLSLIIAHSLNWIFNGQIFVLLKNLGLVNIDPAKFKNYTEKISERIVNHHSFNSAALFGSLCRQELSCTSDLDVRIIRKPGIVNGLNSCLFIVEERSRAFFSGFPLDIYLLDTDKNLKKMSETNPIIILDRDNILKNFYVRNL